MQYTYVVDGKEKLIIRKLTVRALLLRVPLVIPGNRPKGC